MTAWTGISPWWWARLAVEAAGLFVVATLVFDAIHYTLHRWQDSRRGWLRRLAGLHQAHRDFCDRGLVYHDHEVASNLLKHAIPEYATQLAVCAAAFALLDPAAVVAVMAAFTAVFAGVLALRGKDRHHRRLAPLPPAHAGLLVRAPYHALHHVYPDSYLGSYTTLFDRLMGTACQVRGRRFALTGASGAFGSALRGLLERAGAEVVPLKFGVDYSYEDYSGADAVLATADVLVLAHGARSADAMRANCESSLALIARFKDRTRDRLVPPEVWALGSEIELHPAIGGVGLRAYARSKRAFARAAARLFFDPDMLYRHIVPSAFRSRMGPGLIGGRTAAAVAFWMIRRGFRYVPVTYTGIALLNAVPFLVRAWLAVPGRARGGRSEPASHVTRPIRQPSAATPTG
jgi:hypothetical protein